MRADFATRQLRCPVCHADRTLSLQAARSDEREVREGRLRCSRCGSDFEVERGVGYLLHDPPAHVLREAVGLARFAEHMRSEGWDRERILALPHVPDGYWYTQARSMQQVLNTVEFQPGQWLVDVGSNTCWAANQFARRGLNVVALDIATAEMQGLFTADYFLEAGTSYFERVLGTMNDMPLASGSLDYVYCCEVLHHNDPAGLRMTFEEARRVLKPGGKLLVINETLKALRDRIGVHTDKVEEYGGYEHAYWAWRYRREASRAGFSTTVLEPPYAWPFDPGKVEEPPPGRHPRKVAKRLGLGMAMSRAGRGAYLTWLNHVDGGVQLNMIATKPGQ